MNNPRRDGGTSVPEKVKPLSGQEPPSLRGRSSLKRLRRQCVQGQDIGNGRANARQTKPILRYRRPPYMIGYVVA